MRFIHLIFIALYCVLCGFNSYPNDFPKLPKLSIVVADDKDSIKLHVLVATSLIQMRNGLMHMPVLADDQGMLFVYDEERRRCMWMKNTPVPLDVAFFNADGGLINVHTMPALSLQSYCSSSGAQYALEVRANWFTDFNISKPAHVAGVPGIW